MGPLRRRPSYDLLAVGFAVYMVQFVSRTRLFIGVGIVYGVGFPQDALPLRLTVAAYNNVLTIYSFLLTTSNDRVQTDNVNEIDWIQCLVNKKWVSSCEIILYSNFQYNRFYCPGTLVHIRRPGAVAMICAM